MLAPDIDPVAIHLGPLKIHWYGLMYLIGFLGAWWLGVYRAKRPGSGWRREEIADLLFYGALGVILGGRLGYVLFYNFSYYLQHPVEVFYIWSGGMSFHGGLLGVIVAMWLYARRTRRAFFAVADFVALLTPLGLGAGRLGNFINHELWGRVTDVPWGMVFPTGGPLPRHPSQLYEATLEGLVLLAILAILVRKGALRRPGLIIGVFAVGYGIARSICELFRQPDPQLGFLWGGLTMGILLSVPLVLAGIAFIVVALRRAPLART